MYVCMYTQDGSALTRPGKLYSRTNRDFYQCFVKNSVELVPFYSLLVSFAWLVYL